MTPIPILSLPATAPGAGGLTTNKFLNAFAVDLETGRIGLPVLTSSGALSPHSPMYVSSATKPLLDRTAAMIHREANRLFADSGTEGRCPIPATDGAWSIEGDPAEIQLTSLSGPEMQSIRIHLDPRGQSLRRVDVRWWVDRFEVWFANELDAEGRLKRATCDLFHPLPIDLGSLPLRETFGLAPDAPWYEVGLAMADELVARRFFPEGPEMLIFNCREDLPISQNAADDIWEMITAKLDGEKTDDAGHSRIRRQPREPFVISPILSGSRLALPQEIPDSYLTDPEMVLKIRCRDDLVTSLLTSVEISPSRGWIATTFDYALRLMIP